jgi:hypothetical protein
LLLATVMLTEKIFPLKSLKMHPDLRPLAKKYSSNSYNKF